MSERTSTSTSVNPNTSTASSDVQLLDAATNDGAVPWYTATTEEQRARVAADWAASGLPLQEYATALADFASYAEWAAETGVQEQEQGAAILAQALEQHTGEGDGKTGAGSPAVPPPAPWTMAQVVGAYKAGVKGQRTAFLRAGRMAYELVHHLAFVARTHSRDVAVDGIGAELGWVAGHKVNANDLIRTWQATELLGQGSDSKDVPYSTLEAYCPLVERDADKDVWYVVPSVADEAKALFADSARPQPKVRSGAEVQRRVALLVAKAKAAAAQEAAKAASDPKAGKAARDAAAKAQEQADKAAARAVALNGDKAAVEAGVQVPVTEGEQDRTQERKPKAPVPTECAAPVVPLQAMAAAATAKDLAASLLAQLKANDEPEDALVELLRLVRASGDFRPKVKTAVDAFLRRLVDVSAGPSPTQLATANVANGHVAAVA